MNNENMAVYPPYRLVAQFADGARLLFDGLTEAQAQQSMEAAQAQHGDIAWYDGVTDLHYENGKYYKLIPPPPEVALIGLTEYTGPLDENGLPPSLTGNPPANHENDRRSQITPPRAQNCPPRAQNLRKQQHPQPRPHGPPGVFSCCFLPEIAVL